MAKISKYELYIFIKLLKQGCGILLKGTEIDRDLATAHFLTGIESLFTVIFEGMIKNGSIKHFDATQLAFEYTAPITPLIHWHDREPAKDKEIMEKIEKHIAHFINVYGNKEKQ